MIFVFISAILYVLAFPFDSRGLCLGPFIFISLVPFFYSIERAHSTLKRLASGLIWGIFFSLGMSYWLLPTMTGEYGLSLPHSAAFMTVAVLFPHGALYGVFAVLYGTLDREGRFFYPLIVPSLWIMIEYVRVIFPFFIPWALTAYALDPEWALTQSADLIGPHGLSFIIVFVNTMIFYILKTVCKVGTSAGKEKRSVIQFLLRVRFILIMSAAVPMLLGVYGSFRRDTVNDELLRTAESGAVPVVLAQCNFDQRERWEDSSLMERMRIAMELSGGPDNGAGLILWPETTLNSCPGRREELLSFIRNWLGSGRVLIAGGVRSGPDKKGLYNSAFCISGRGYATYDQRILLPYAETGVSGGGISVPYEFLKGRSSPAIRSGLGDLGLSICFESLYPVHVRESVRAGARALVNISNDGWFGISPEPPMHLRQARFRAIENRRYMARVSNNGYSAIVDAAGGLLAVSGLFTREQIRGGIVLMKRLTFYTRFGDWIVYAAGVALLAAFIAVVFVKDPQPTG